MLDYRPRLYTILLQVYLFYPSNVGILCDPGTVQNIARPLGGYYNYYDKLYCGGIFLRPQKFGSGAIIWTTTVN